MGFFWVSPAIRATRGFVIEEGQEKVEYRKNSGASLVQKRLQPLERGCNLQFLGS